MADRSFILRMLLASTGLLAWATHFLVIYVVAALACARDFAGASLAGFDAVDVITVATTVLALGAIAAAMLYARRSAAFAGLGTFPPGARVLTPSFLRWMTQTIGALSIVAILYDTLPVFMLQTCA